jgi:chemotaxis response regulator CheB
MMMLDIICEIVASQPEFAVVDKMTAHTDLARAVRRSRADLVIVQHTGDLDDAGEELLLSMQRPVPIIGISGDGHSGVLYKLRPHRVPLGKMGADGLVAAIRAAAQSERACEP